MPHYTEKTGGLPHHQTKAPNLLGRCRPKTRDRNNTQWNDGKTKKDGNHSPTKGKLVQDSKANEENRYPVPDSNKTKINYPKECNKAHKNNLKEETLQEITENFMEMLLEKVNQNIQEALKKFQDKKRKRT
jgi:DNA-binding protein Fis